MLVKDAVVLGGRYRLIQPITPGTDYSVWIAVDKHDNEFLVKCWRFAGNRPADVHRALWDLELRNLLRLASSPEADSHLVVLRDAGVDNDLRQFVMVLQSPGLTTLDTVLESRGEHEWLRGLNQPEIRASLWRGLRLIAKGLGQLHEQQMLHRILSVGSVLLNPKMGPQSMRLGGFEWTVRLGASFATSSLQTLPPPEWHTESQPLSVFSFESDWFLYGALVARLLVPTTPPAPEVYASTIARVQSEVGLFDVERDLILRLLDPNPAARLARAQDVTSRIDAVLARLDQPILIGPDKHLALIVSLGARMRLTEAIIEQDDSITTAEIEKQREFIQKDLCSPSAIRQPNGWYVLKGTRLTYSLLEYKDDDSPASGLWALAYCPGPTELRFSEGGSNQRELTQVPIRVFDKSTFRRHAAAVRSSAVHWTQFLPQTDRAERTRARLQQFHEFFRLTNQIELLFGDATIFAYERVSYIPGVGQETVVIRQGKRDRPVPEFASSETDLIGFLIRQTTEKEDGDRVYLGHDDTLKLESRVDLPFFWKVIDIDEEKREVVLRRTHDGKPVPPPEKGFLRGYGLFGQVSLVRRRKDAIDKLKTHSYLLQAILSPDFLYIHTGSADLPRPIQGQLDSAKEKAIQSIWETRPIFALQGPPGTGKTTLVANLLGQIFADDPVAQVLVSAQAHSAVDVLRDKVKTETFRDAPEKDQPLSIRIPRSGDELDDDPDYPAPAARRMFEGALNRIPLDAEGLRGRWRVTVNEVVSAIKRREGGDLVELVKRSANLTYCTTTSANLARLAVSTQSFDWSIIEEAGKAHGFDLVLPLQNGHRWLLIGDQKQLAPIASVSFSPPYQGSMR